jgi:DNA replication protein DnaC
MSTGLLFLDELGFEQLDGVAFEIINARYNKQATTIVTTGLQPAEFARRYGSAVWRRQTESGALIEDHGRKLAAVR